MPNRRQCVSQFAAVLMACGLIASLLPGFAAADTADNQWGPGYRITHNGLRIDGIRADNPTNRVIYDNDFFFDAMDFAYLAAQHKLGRVDFRGFIVTRNSHQVDGYVRMVREYNHYRDLAIQSGLNIPRHIDGAREPLRRPGSGRIDDTQYTLSDGARLIIQQADASTPDNPLIVFVGGQLTTVATALIEKPSIANRLIVFGAGQLTATYNSHDGWSAYVTAMRAPVVNMRESFAKVDGGYDKSKKQYDPLPKNPLINAFYKTKVVNEQDAGIVDGGTVVWLFNQHLVTGAQRRNMNVPASFRDNGVLNRSYTNVNVNPYGHLHLPDGSCKFAAMIDAMVAVLADPRVWDPDYSAKPVPNQSTNPIASAQAIDQTTQTARTARAGAIVLLDGPVLAGKPVTFRLNGNPSNPHWDLGDGATADSSSVTHTYQKPGIHRVVMGSKAGETFNELSSAIVRVHTPETLHLPQVILDTDAANEIDDQHAIAYALFSELDVLAMTTITWIGWKDQKKQTELFVDWCGEAASYNELMKVMDLAKQSGLPASRVPMVFRGAKQPFRYLGLTSDTWFNTQPVITDASNAILAAARGASPDNPVWVLPIGPLGNVASALLQARQQGWATEFSRRIRICWLGGGPGGASTHANGGRDPWAPWVTYKAIAESGTEFVMFLERPTGVSISFDEKTDYDLYPSNPLGNYLKKLVTGYMNQYRGQPRATPKGMYDLGVLSYVIAKHLEKPWLTRVEPSILHPQSPFRPERTTGPTNLDVVHEIDVPAMKKDFWDTLNGRPTALPPNRQN